MDHYWQDGPMERYPSGYATTFNEAPKGAIFLARWDRCSCFFLRAEGNTTFNTTPNQYAVLLGPKFDSSRKFPCAYSESALDNDRVFVLNNTYIKPELSSADSSSQLKEIGSIVYFGDKAYLSASSFHTTLIFDLESGAAPVEVPKEPRVQFERWSIVQKVLDNEETVYTYCLQK